MATLSAIETREVDGFDGYRVSRDGRVFSCHRKCTGGLGAEWHELVARPHPRTRHLMVTLVKDTKRFTPKVHHLVLLAFGFQRPPGYQCRHLNGDPQDNRLENIRWGTAKENTEDRIKHGVQRLAMTSQDWGR